MAHELSITADGRAEMFSGNNVTPWHKLGTVVSGLLTSKEAIEAAHLGWNVSLEPVFTKPGEYQEMEGYFASVRSDTQKGLGIVKSRYSPIQNREAFEFMDNLVADGKMRYETAGALRGGKIVWLMARYNGEVQIAGDTHKQWCLLTTSHDGSRPLSLQWVTERVVCANTLSIAMKGATNQITIRHSANWTNKADEARRVLGLTQSYFAAVRERLDGMAEQRMTREDMSVFSRLLIPAADEMNVPTRSRNIRTEICNLFTRGAGNRGESRWDALQAVTDYADHHATIRGENSTRLESALMGSAAGMKQEAFELLTSPDFSDTLAKHRGQTIRITVPAGLAVQSLN